MVIRSAIRASEPDALENRSSSNKSAVEFETRRGAERAISDNLLTDRDGSIGVSPGLSFWLA